ncbi:unnamed protein product [Rotaria socialis]|uniref:Uncharacterized protein n=1 Tax=Rotaria socialis TaxID=392032 RepID=A0A817T0N9_9BILA|nr:unnamed protein product [Rotaria socialis]CAF4269045.1 unnamed protein product [Rotaria socialis]CAF4444630.1 unnamed protein product [Rotaria socialis]CAF4612718.1 unnamed protein product [Rotaria socialis]CAF4777940.1 unnamed protein product [Rotaria socialis]
MKNNLTDPKLSNCFQGLFPSDNPENAQFRINFFTSIGLGRIINELNKFIISNPTPASSSFMSIYGISLKDFLGHHFRCDNKKKKNTA